MKRMIFLMMIMALLCGAFAAGDAAAAESAAAVTGTVISVDDRFGDVTVSVTPGDLEAAGIHADDVVTVSINGREMDMPVVTSLDGLEWGNLACQISGNNVVLVCYSASFALASGISVLDELDQQVLNERAAQPASVTISLKDRKAYQGGQGLRLGTLAMLNLNAPQLRAFLDTMTIAAFYAQAKQAEEISEDFVRIISRSIQDVIYYDSTSEMLLALEDGLIDGIALNESVADYVTAFNDRLIKVREFPQAPEDPDSAESFLYNLSQNDFAFMLMEENAGLCGEINAVLADMRADGTLAELVRKYISEADPQSLNPVEITRFDGAQTIRVAVTGDLPPMDYIREDGTPAGFSTAVLAEIGKRMERNIELVQTANIGRTMALSSGQVDAVFWTRCRNYLNETLRKDPAEVKFETAGGQDTRVVERLFRFIQGKANQFSPEGVAEGDHPAGTVISDAYYSDPYVFLIRRPDGDSD